MNQRSRPYPFFCFRTSWQNPFYFLVHVLHGQIHSSVLRQLIQNISSLLVLHGQILSFLCTTHSNPFFSLVLHCQIFSSLWNLMVKSFLHYGMVKFFSSETTHLNSFLSDSTFKSVFHHWDFMVKSFLLFWDCMVRSFHLFWYYIVKSFFSVLVLHGQTLSSVLVLYGQILSSILILYMVNVLVLHGQILFSVLVLHGQTLSSVLVLYGQILSSILILYMVKFFILFW